MTVTPFFHGNFTLTRLWATTPASVFAAWANPEIKKKWFAGPEGWTEIRRSMDFRLGGTDIAEGRYEATGMTTLYEGRYHVIETDRRLVYSYDLYLSGEHHSVTLASLLIEPEDGKTRMRYAEQIIFLDGKDGRESRIEGTNLVHDRIERLLGAEGKV